MRISHGFTSLIAQRSLLEASRRLSKGLMQLATGKRMLRPGDDIAGFSQVTQLKTRLQSLGRAAQNVKDGQNLLKTADDAISALSDIVLKMRDLTLEASSTTLTSSQRSALDTQLQSLRTEYEQIVNSTSYNGRKLLDGSFTTSSLQVGADRNQSINLNLNGLEFGKTFKAFETRGLGTFQNTSTMNFSNLNQHVYEADFTGNGVMDLYAGNGADGFSILVGNGSGGFDVSQTFAGTTHFSKPLFTDLTNNGVLDIVVSDRVAGNTYIYLGNGDGTFSSPSTIGFGGGEVLAGDFDGDGNIDLFIRPTETFRGVIRLGDGLGGFTHSQTLEFNDSSVASALVDVDGDGLLDILVLGTPMFGQNTLSVKINNGDGTFSSGATVTVGDFGPTASSFLLGDFNGNGNPDLVINYSGSLQLTVLNGNGDGTFTTGTTLNRGTGVGSFSNLMDINGNGTLDFVIANSTSNNISVFLGNGTGGFTQGATISTGALPSRPILGDFTGDGKTDLVVLNGGGSSASVFGGNGNGTFSILSTISLGTLPLSRPIATDLNGDGILDLILGSQASGNINTFVQDTTTLQVALDFSLSTSQKAQKLLATLDSAIESISAARAKVAAQQSRLEFTANSTLLQKEALESARSSIEDVDIASTMGEILKAQIQQQAAIAVLAQANTQWTSLLDLLPRNRSFRDR